MKLQKIKKDYKSFFYFNFLNGADAFITLYALSLGHTEFNPIMNRMYEYDVISTTILKLFIGVFVSCMFFLTDNKHGHRAGKIASDFIRGKGSLSTYPNRVRAKLGTFFLESDQLTPLLYEWGMSSDIKEHLLRLCLFANIVSMTQLERLKRENDTAIKGIVEEWNRSKIKQPLTDILEQLNFLYLRIKHKYDF